MKTTITTSVLLVMMMILSGSSTSAAPLEVNAKALITKVYGVASTSLHKHEICDAALQHLSMQPEEEESGMWLDSEDGYELSYRGMSPKMCAMAHFNNNTLTEYRYFFIFPYISDNRAEANSNQADFAGSLLQEISDLGADMGSDILTDAIFATYGSYGESHLEVTLTDDSTQYILMLKIEPEAFLANDSLMAQN